MTQTIDPIKLKAAAEHLEQVLKQYPDNKDVQEMLRGLQPLIEDAKAGKVLEPIGRQDIPFRWAVSAEGLYRSYKDPDVEGAYIDFAIEMEGGLTEQDKQRHTRLEAMWEVMKSEAKS